MRVLCATPYGDLVASESAADGNCFYHSYLQCALGASFRTSDKEAVLRLKRYVSERVTPERIYALNDPVHFDLLRTSVDQFLERRGVKPAAFMGSDFSIRGYLLELEKTSPALMKDPEFVDHIHLLIQQYGAAVKRKIEKNGSWADDTILPLFCSIMGVDITFLDTKLRPVQLALPNPCEHHILMLHSGAHFEPMGVRQGGEVFRVLTGTSVEKLLLFLKDRT